MQCKVVLDDFFTGECNDSERIVTCLEFIARSDVLLHSNIDNADSLFELLEKGLSYKYLNILGETFIHKLNYLFGYFYEYNSILEVCGKNIEICRSSNEELISSLVNTMNTLYAISYSTFPYYVMLKIDSNYAVVYVDGSRNTSLYGMFICNNALTYLSNIGISDIINALIDWLSSIITMDSNTYVVNTEIIISIITNKSTFPSIPLAQSGSLIGSKLTVLSNVINNIRKEEKEMNIHSLREYSTKLESIIQQDTGDKVEVEEIIPPNHSIPVLRNNLKNINSSSNSNINISFLTEDDLNYNTKKFIKSSGSPSRIHRDQNDPEKISSMSTTRLSALHRDDDYNIRSSGVEGLQLSQEYNYNELDISNIVTDDVEIAATLSSKPNYASSPIRKSITLSTSNNGSNNNILRESMKLRDSTYSKLLQSLESDEDLHAYVSRAYNAIKNSILDKLDNQEIFDVADVSDTSVVQVSNGNNISCSSSPVRTSLNSNHNHSPYRSNNNISFNTDGSVKASKEARLFSTTQLYGSRESPSRMSKVYEPNDNNSRSNSNDFSNNVQKYHNDDEYMNKSTQSPNSCGNQSYNSHNIDDPTIFHGIYANNSTNNDISSSSNNYQYNDRYDDSPDGLDRSMDENQPEYNARYNEVRFSYENPFLTDSQSIYTRDSALSRRSEYSTSSSNNSPIRWNKNVNYISSSHDNVIASNSNNILDKVIDTNPLRNSATQSVDMYHKDEGIYDGIRLELLSSREVIEKNNKIVVNNIIKMRKEQALQILASIFTKSNQNNNISIKNQNSSATSSEVDSKKVDTVKINFSELPPPPKDIPATDRNDSILPPSTSWNINNTPPVLKLKPINDSKFMNNANGPTNHSNNRNNIKNASTHSNYLSIKNALNSVCLAGTHFDEQRNCTLSILDLKANSNNNNNNGSLQTTQFLILFHHSKCLSYKGLYEVCPYTGKILKLVGKGPKCIDTKQIQNYLKYETSTKSFKILSIYSIAATVDAISIDPSLVKLKK